MDSPRRATIRRWIAKAENDVRTAQVMLRAEPPVTDVVCFHAQQCAEKALKAFLVSSDLHVEKTHYLPRLVELCAGAVPTFDGLRDLAAELTDYAVESRYPDDWREIPVEEARAAVEKTEKVLEFVRTRVERPGSQE